MAKTMKNTHDVFGEILMSSEFVDNFYICFFTLSPNSELKFTDVEMQKKAFLGLITALLQIADDSEKLEWIKKKHQRMRVSDDEIKAFCSSLLVTLKCSNKISLSQSKVLQRIEKQVEDLQKFMCSDEKNGCIIQ